MESRLLSCSRKSAVRVTYGVTHWYSSMSHPISGCRIYLQPSHYQNISSTVQPFSQPTADSTWTDQPHSQSVPSKEASVSSQHDSAPMLLMNNGLDHMPKLLTQSPVDVVVLTGMIKLIMSFSIWLAGQCQRMVKQLKSMLVMQVLLIGTECMSSAVQFNGTPCVSSTEVTWLMCVHPFQLTSKASRRSIKHKQTYTRIR